MLTLSGIKMSRADVCFVLILLKTSYGWWEAVVLDRNGDMLSLRFRD